MFLPILLLFFSCQKKLTANEYGQYVTDPKNGLRKDVNMGDFEISVMYEPVEYLLGKEENTNDYESRKKELEEFEHFQFRIKLKTGGNILMYKENQQMNEVSRINHFGFLAKNDFCIVSGKDTNFCTLSHYSRNYNLTPTIDLSLAFEKMNKENDWQFIYNDKQFNLGRIKFLFRKDDISDLPGLKK